MTSLKNILKSVSRSFYLSLILLPKKVRTPMGLAFLACKTADTLADTSIISKGERLKLLDAYREMFAQPNQNSSKEIIKSAVGAATLEEQRLIQNLPLLMESLKNLDMKVWAAIQELVLEVTQGMQMDLQYFPGESAQELKAFDNEGELEQYIYLVAGCVGRFWTKMMHTHFSFAKHFENEMEHWGEKMGKGLQLVNILRDLPHDLRRGRCYIPEKMLQEVDLNARSLLDPKKFTSVKPILFQLSGKAKNYLQVSDTYCQKFPRYALRLKSVVRLPARLGIQTLQILEESPDWLNPEKPHKVSRRQVYQTLIGAFFK